MDSPISEMTLRDWFAGQALSGILAGESDEILAEAIPKLHDYYAQRAYKLADLMLKERKRDA